MGDAAITFSDGAPIFPLYQALQAAGFSNRDLDVGSFPRDLKERVWLGARAGAGDGQVDDVEVWQFVSERRAELADLIDGVTRVHIERMSAETLERGQRFLDAVLRPLVAKRYAATDPDFAAAMAYGLFIFVQFPMRSQLDRLSADARTKFLAEHFPDAARYGLAPLGATLLTDGGLNGIPFGHSHSYGATSSDPIDYSELVIGAAYDAGNATLPQYQLLTLLRRAGLQPMPADVFTPEAPHNGCALQSVARPGVGLRDGAAIHLYLPGRTNDAHGSRYPWIELSESDLLASDVFMSNMLGADRHQGNQPLIGWASEHSFAAASRVLRGMTDLIRDSKGGGDAAAAMAATVRLMADYPPLSTMGLLFLFGEGAPEQIVRAVDVSAMQPWLSEEGRVLMSAAVAWRAQGFPAARAILDPFLRTRPACVFGHGALAMMARVAGEHAVAESAYQRVAAAFWFGQTDPSITARLGRIAQVRGNREQAAHYFQAVAEDAGASTEERRHASWRLVELSRPATDSADASYQSALEQYAAALRRDLVGVPVKTLDAERALWSEDGPAPWAATNYSMPAERRVEEARVVAALADLYAMQGEWARAVELQERAARHCPEDAWLYADLVTLWAQQGAWERVGSGVGDPEGFIRTLTPPDAPPADGDPTATPPPSPPIKINEDF